MLAPCLAAAGALLLVGCRPSFSECEDAWRRFEAATLAKLEGPRKESTAAFLASQKAEFVKVCHERGDRDQVHCVQRADSLEKVEKCAAR